MHHLRTLSSLLLLLAVLSGCASTIRRAHPLATASAAINPAIAIEANGQRHVVWEECAQVCSIQYERTRLGKAPVRIAFVAASGQIYRRPDVAVTSAGVVYVIWEHQSTAATPLVTPFLAILQPGATTVPTIQAVTTASAVVAGGDRPRLAARGTTVYASYVVSNGTAGKLYQRRLAPAWEAETILMDISTIIPTAVRLAIDSLNRLHLAYKIVTTDNLIHAVYYDGPTTNAQNLAVGQGLNRYSVPDLELDSADNAYMTYIDTGTTASDQQLFVVRRKTDGTLTSFPMLAAQAPYWGPFFQPDSAIVGEYLEISFTARHGLLEDRAVVWNTSLNLSTGAIAVPQQISAVSVMFPRNPQIANVNGYIVIMWMDKEPGSLDCDYNGFTWDPAHGVQTVHTKPEGTGGCYIGQLDVAAAGQWAAGVFIDRDIARATTPVPWVAFNTYGTFIPLAVR